MKKGLLTITAGLLFGFGAIAQTYDASIFTLQDSAINVDAMSGLTKTNGYGTAPAPEINKGYACNTVSWEGDVVKIDFENTKSPDQWADFSFSLIQWQGTLGKAFTTDTAGVAQAHDTVRGYTVDFTDKANRVLSFKVQADAALNLRCDLGDVTGKLSNGNGTIKTDIAATAGGVALTDAAKWTEVSLSWGGDATATANVDVEILNDIYSEGWWDVNKDFANGAINGAGRLRGGSLNPVDLDMSRIAKISFTIDDGAQGTVGDKKVLYIKDIKLGAGTATTWKTWAPWKTSISAISGAELEVVGGVIYSAGTITVQNAAGQVISTSNGQLNISSLPAGVLIITAAEGTAKIVK